MNHLVLALVVAAFSVAKSDMEVPHLGLCRDHFPKAGCILTNEAICSEECDWGEQMETHDCDSGTNTCARPCFWTRCKDDPPVVDCHALQDCLTTMITACSKSCGIGVQHEMVLCGDGPKTCRRNCCCQPCNFNRGSGVAPPILCRDVHVTATSCPHQGTVS